VEALSKLHADKLKERESVHNALKRAIQDSEYRLRLKTDPILALREAGIDIPEGVEVTILEIDPNRRYLFLPPASPGTDAADTQSPSQEGH
jgi:hypothetical protein